MKYEEARAKAQQRANATGCDQGMEYNKIFLEYMIYMLPPRQYRRGHELRCEVVHPENPATTRVGHGPGGIEP